VGGGQTPTAAGAGQPAPRPEATAARCALIDPASNAIFAIALSEKAFSGPALLAKVAQIL
jgi:hypothetical protein